MLSSSAGSSRRSGSTRSVVSQVTNTLRRAPSLRTAKTYNEQMREIVDAGEFLADTKWGELDLLLLDLPPDTDRDPNRHCR